MQVTSNSIGMLLPRSAQCLIDRLCLEREKTPCETDDLENIFSGPVEYPGVHQRIQVNLRLHGEAIVDVDTGRAQIAPPASQDRFWQICAREVTVRDTASAKTVWSQVQVVERKEVYCLREEGSQTDGASKVDQILWFHTITKIEKEAIAHRSSMVTISCAPCLAPLLATEARPRQTCCREITETTAFPMLLQLEIGNGNASTNLTSRQEAAKQKKS